MDEKKLEAAANKWADDMIWALVDTKRKANYDERAFLVQEYKDFFHKRFKDMWVNVSESLPTELGEYLVKRHRGNSETLYFMLLNWNGNNWVTSIKDPLEDKIECWLDLSSF